MGERCFAEMPLGRYRHGCDTPSDSRFTDQAGLCVQQKLPFRRQPSTQLSCPTRFNQFDRSANDAMKRSILAHSFLDSGQAALARRNLPHAPWNHFRPDTRSLQIYGSMHGSPLVTGFNTMEREES